MLLRDSLKVQALIVLWIIIVFIFYYYNEIRNLLNYLGAL